MIWPEIFLDLDALHALQERVARAPERARRFAKELEADLEQMALAILGAEPGPPAYPIDWTSERQWRYVMAKLRREGNLPYRRTHALSRGWRVESVLGVGEREETWIVLTHDSPPVLWRGREFQVWQFVMGEYQQFFHAVTGWRNVHEVAFDLSEFAVDQVIDFWGEVLH